MKVRFSDLNFYNGLFKKEIENKLRELISDSKFIGGIEKQSFENNFADYCETKYCVGVGNCTDAIEIALEAMDLPNGSEVIVPSNSFIATSEAVTRAGLKVVFADCDPNNYTLSLESLKDKITSNTTAIIAVHLYGHPADMDEIKQIVNGFDIKIVEDCAQAHGALYKGKKVGGLGTVSAFSFFPGKNLGAFGDAGCIITDSEELAKKARMIANHGRIDKYSHHFEGRNSRLDNIQAAILNIKLNKLDSINSLRIKNANFYYKELSKVKDIILPKKEKWATSVFHQFVIRTENREELIEFLENKGIQTGIHYPIALPKLKAYQYLKSDYSSFFSMKNDSKILSIPISEHLTKDQIKFIVDSIKEHYNNV